MVNESDTVQMSQQFPKDGKDDGTIFVSRIGKDTGFRFAFATANKYVAITFYRGNHIKDKIVPRMVFEDNTDTSEEAVDKALLLMSELIENLDNNVPL